MLEASGADEAFALVEQHSAEIHLLLTDVILPGMNGMTCPTSYGLTSETQSAVYLGIPTGGDRTPGVLEPEVAYLAKPLSPETLAAKVREVLGKPQ